MRAATLAREFGVTAMVERIWAQLFGGASCERRPYKKRSGEMPGAPRAEA